MNIEKVNARNSSMDLVRIVAVLSVICVHFFLHNGFYSETVVGFEMYMMVIMRTLFSICVPLFMVLSGYLMSKKTLSKKYYSGLRKTIIIYILASIVCMIFKGVSGFEGFNIINLNLKNIMLSTLSFTGANYCWYIEMYIGLFLIIPFLNILYSKLESKKHKHILLLTLITLTILPSFFNIFNFESFEWWTNPASSDNFQKIIPSWWTGIYPVTYYFVGCYLREYNLKFRIRHLVPMLVSALVLFASFNYYRSYGTYFKSGTYIYWNGFETFILTVLTFLILSRLSLNNLPLKAKYAMWKISDLALGVYLLSFIFDALYYTILKENVLTLSERLPYFFLLVPCIFLSSLALSAILNFIAKLIEKLWKKIYSSIINLKNSSDKSKIMDKVFFVLFFCVLAFSIWKCFFGFGGYDEAFYLTVPHRLTLGDSLLSEEWHLSQLSGFLLVPFVSLYKLIFQSTDGIILAARFAYIAMHSASAIFIYKRLRKYGPMSVAASILYYIYTPFDIMALSYNTMGLEAITVAGIAMATSDLNKKLPLILSGIVFSAAVLCSPYLAIAYILFGLCVIVHHIQGKLTKKKNIFSINLFRGKTFLWFTVGVCILASIFIIFLLSRASISEILENLPLMMTDPEHPHIPFNTRVYYYFNSIFTFVDNFSLPVFVFFIMLAIMIIDRKRRNHRSIYLFVSGALVIFTYILILPQLTYAYYNAIMFPMIFIGITSYILCKRKPRKLFATLFLLGIIYSVCLSMSSNQYFYAISMATSASNIASLIFLSVVLKEMKETPDTLLYNEIIRKSLLVFISFIIFLQGAFQITVKSTHCFWDGNVNTLNSQIKDGPAKGIFTTQDNCERINSIYEDFVGYRNEADGNMLSLTLNTFTYLVDDKPFATYSAWLSGVRDTSITRLKEYYILHPDKVPQYIYITKDAEIDLSNIYNDAQVYGYTVTENGLSYKLKKIN